METAKYRQNIYATSVLVVERWEGDLKQRQGVDSMAETKRGAFEAVNNWILVKTLGGF